MRFVLGYSVAFSIIFLQLATAHEIKSEQGRAAQWLRDANDRAGRVYYNLQVARWVYATNITKFNGERQHNASIMSAEFDREAAENATSFAWENFTDSDLRRQFRKISDVGSAALLRKDKAKYERLISLVTKMETTYSEGQVCDKKGTCLDLEPGLTRLMATSRNYSELLDAWKGWRDATGRKIRDDYKEFVSLSNEAAVENGYRDTGDYWRSWYDTADFRDQLEQLYEEMKPLYLNLHAYVKNKLKAKYGESLFPPSGHIPAHLLGNMWAQSWNNIFDIVEPFAGKPSVDVTPKMKELNYTPRRMFNISDEFFTSLGLEAMPQEFWDHSMLEKPTDGRKVVCHASAWDFYNKKDFRIKQCTDITMDDLITVHHEMGHVEYYLQYKEQPVVYRRGANPGFHEAVGDVLALSVSTPTHLKEIGLLDNVTNDNESVINYLMSIALDKIAFIPFGYLMDQWRWGVFNGSIKFEEYNKEWWKLRCKYQGVSPPIHRNESDFDPGAKYHIPANTPYIRYFVSYVLQFQFHEALCNTANQTGPLHMCDIYRSTEAGAKLGNMLKLGSSKPWPEALEKVTGTRNMSANAILLYFKPLIDWLKVQNQGQTITWSEECPIEYYTTTSVPSTAKPANSTGRLHNGFFIVAFISVLALYILR
ncbi:angiotensin-converting enzyme-like [Lingula anatina]|uniref:Angiotensin-converting enzyme n=1 Tax=Lingula anatina TaxID=7574 RepID=A0A1S3I8D7_LINAN|nr:angiotensin-converting enzyme-like [Lingula anatina]|eukprot:XP_013394530.1 angiotensin-converting enzyme-like [Lingula anatina]